MLERLIWISLGIDCLAGLFVLLYTVWPTNWPGSWFLLIIVVFLWLPALGGYWLLRTHHPLGALIVAGFPMVWGLPTALKLLFQLLSR